VSFAVDHLGIAVRSLRAARTIYETLGLRLSSEETVLAEKVRLIMVELGNTRLELLEATSDDSVIAKFITRRGEGLHHIGLRVPDLARTVEKLKAQGVRLVTEEIKIGAGGHPYVFVHPSSASGVLVELVDSGG
jgi:methylmalonyl-CoA epimerase